MSVLGRLFGRREARASLESPTNPITLDGLASLYHSPTESGVTVSTDSALRLSTVFACVKIVAQSVASVRREIHRVDAQGVSQNVTDLPIFGALTREPNEYMSAFDFFVMMQAHVELWGNAYAAIERNGRGEPARLVPLISGNVRPVRQGGRLLYYVSRMDNLGSDVLPSTEVIHLRGLSLDGLAALAPLNQGREAIGAAKAQEAYGARFFKNDARPGVVLSHPGKLGEDVLRRLKTSWTAFFGGSGQHSAAVLEEGMTVHQVGIAPEHAQFLESRKFSRQEIAALFGVPLSMLADPDAITYRSSEADDLRFSKHSILPRVKAWEGEFNRKLFDAPSGLEVSHDLSELERGAFKDRIDGLSQGVQNALFTPNEARSRLGLPPLPGGDELVLQQNMAGVQAITSGAAGNGVGNAIGEGGTDDDED